MQSNDCKRIKVIFLVEAILKILIKMEYFDSYSGEEVNRPTKHRCIIAISSDSDGYTEAKL